MSAIESASHTTGVSVGDLTAMALIESGGDANIGTNRYGYTGLMQIGRMAASDVGMSMRDVTGAGNVSNNALAAALLWVRNARSLSRDIPRTTVNLYLAHQLGARGMNELWATVRTNPNQPLTENQRGQLPGAVMRQLSQDHRVVTQRDFYDFWVGRAGGIREAIH
jgi:hypothetical protein